jgi:hypothetical protein
MIIKLLATKYNISYSAIILIGSEANLSKHLLDKSINNTSKYQQIIGSLLYIAQIIKLEILFAIITLAKSDSSASE